MGDELSMDPLWLNRRRLLRIGGLGSLVLALGRAAPATAAEPFRIGALNPITGAGAEYGTGIQKTIVFAAQEVNEAGGAAGRMFEVFAEDDQTAPDAGVLAAKKLIEVNKVHAIMGTWASGVTLAVMPIQDAANVILMTNSGAESISTLDKKDLVFRFSATSERVGKAVANILAREGYGRVATMAFNNASGRGVTDGAKEAWEKLGRKLVAEVVYEPRQASYRSELQHILAADPDVVVLGSYLPDTTIIVREAVQAGARAKFIAPGYAITPKLIEALGAAATEGLMSVDYVSALDGAAYAHFAQRYKAVVGRDVGDNFYAACAYDMVHVTALAIEAAGPGADNFAIVGALRKVANPPGQAVSSFAQGKPLLQAGQKIDFGGASGPLDFDQYGDVNPLFKLSVVQNGAIEFRYMITL